MLGEGHLPSARAGVAAITGLSLRMCIAATLSRMSERPLPVSPLLFFTHIRRRGDPIPSRADLDDLVPVAKRGIRSAKR